MGHTTDELVDMAKKVWAINPASAQTRNGSTPRHREQVTIALIAMALSARGTKAISFTGGQIGLITDANFSKARVKEIDHKRIVAELDKGKIVIVAGFQGVTADGDVTTLGRAAATPP